MWYCRECAFLGPEEKDCDCFREELIMPKFIEVTVGTNQTRLLNVDHVVDVCKKKIELLETGEQVEICVIFTTSRYEASLVVNETYEQIKTMMSAENTEYPSASDIRQPIGAFEKYLSGEKGV